MAEVSSTALQNDLRWVLRRLATGEEVVITVAGEPVATMSQNRQRPQWLSRAEFMRRFSDQQADPAMREELAALSPDTTDDLAL
jgi:antitoxin (DNA-binding transcriptional repressor) of toxin-antitoxin stability system